jgi:peptide deformylase
MAVLKVRRYGDPVLRRRAEPIATVTPEIRRLADDMIETMYDEVGIGLAAPQIGASVRLLVVGDEEGRGAQVLVNPVITEQGGTVTAEEGCLSLPGFFAPVTRAQWVKVEAQDLEGQPLSLTARGLRSRVFQHEIDHLDGVLFIDRVDAVTRDRMKRRIKKDGFTEDASAHRAFAL